jgi:hypothetical protein
MEWQDVASLAIVALAAVLLFRWKYRTLRRDLSAPCGGSCSCNMRNSTVSPGQSLENGPRE